MKFKLINKAKGQLSIELILPVEIPENTPNWRRKRLQAVRSAKRYLIPSGGFEIIEFDSREACFSQPQISRFMDQSRLDVYEVSEKKEKEKEEKHDVIVPPFSENQSFGSNKVLPDRDTKRNFEDSKENEVNKQDSIEDAVKVTETSDVDENIETQRIRFNKVSTERDTKRANSADNKIACMLCGSKYKRITALHLRKKHDMSIDEYREQFPGVLLSPQ